MSVYSGKTNLSVFLRVTMHTCTRMHACRHTHIHTRAQEGGFATGYVAGHVLTCSENDYLELPTSSHVSWWNCSRR